MDKLNRIQLVSELRNLSDAFTRLHVYQIPDILCQAADLLEKDPCVGCYYRNPPVSMDDLCDVN